MRIFNNCLANNTRNFFSIDFHFTLPSIILSLILLNIFRPKILIFLSFDWSDIKSKLFAQKIIMMNLFDTNNVIEGESFKIVLIFLIMDFFGMIGLGCQMSPIIFRNSKKLVVFGRQEDSKRDLVTLIEGFMIKCLSSSWNTLVKLFDWFIYGFLVNLMILN